MKEDVVFAIALGHDWGGCQSDPEFFHQNSLYKNEVTKNS